MFLRNLIRARIVAQVTQEAVAAQLEWSVSKAIRIEGVIIGLSQAVQNPRLWDDYKNVVPDAYPKLIGYEAGASAIRSYNPSLVPDLLTIQVIPFDAGIHQGLAMGSFTLLDCATRSPEVPRWGPPESMTRVFRGSGAGGGLSG
ncbi:hypothetical protein [Nonomuraea sp. NPDC049709]|uniref:hypothetical protein n=1 Tax=Nonomuraea sp. NPDC049709 TaxID=3154736 RepID=UPI003426D3FD